MIKRACPANSHKASRGGTRRAREHNGKKNYNKLQTKKLTNWWIIVNKGINWQLVHRGFLVQMTKVDFYPSRSNSFFEIAGDF